MILLQVERTPDQTPTGFVLGMRQVRVREVIDRWLGEDYAYYKVRDERDVIYILRHDQDEDSWEITLMDATGDVARIR